MRLKTCLTPPAGTLMNTRKWRDEIIFPVVFGRTVQVGDQEEHRTHVGLWCVHVDTGLGRFIEAPMYLKRMYRGHPFDWKKTWMSRGTHEGSLVFSLSEKQSYDIAYHLLLFDGEQWSQITREQRHVRLLTLGEEHGVRVLSEPSTPGRPALFEGGALLRAENPTRFAVDFTHAFAYDSGPDTPRSPEYLALSKEISSLPQAIQSLPGVSTEVKEEALKLVPEPYREESLHTEMFYVGDEVWVTVVQYSYVDVPGFVQLIQLT